MSAARPERALRILVADDDPDTARRLRKEFGTACPLLVAVTGLHESAAKTIGKMAGFHHYLTKPYATNALLDLLASLIYRSPLPPGGVL